MSLRPSLYFIRVRDCTSRDVAGRFPRLLGSCGRVCRRGLGTVEDSKAGWFVVQLDVRTVSAVRQVLSKLNLGKEIDLIEPVSRIKDGLAMTRQLALF